MVQCLHGVIDPKKKENMAPPDALNAVVADWKANARLVSQGGTGIMSVVSKKNDLSRQEVCTNYEVLAPIVKHLGH